MPVSYIPSAEQLIDRQKTTAKKRRRNQNAEIDELAKLLPVKPLLIPSSEVGGAFDFFGAGGSGGGDAGREKNQPVDKISVLRITSTFLKFQEFLKQGHFPLSIEDKNSDHVPISLMSEAMDGFLLVLDKDATILFASESITSHIGLTQHDVIGQNLVDVTHPNDKEIIGDNLVPKATLPPGITNKDKDIQPRQFYIRFKSTMSPGRMQLSRFNSYTMVQVTGNLKVHILDIGTELGQDDKQVVGFVGECRLIESTASILEISIPQSYFTTTISLDMKIVSVESQLKELVGFSTEEFIGTRLRDYFHPADYTKLIPCEVMLMHTGHAVSPQFRFMSATGGWVWMQMEGMLRYKPGTKERQFWEVKVKMVSQEEGHFTLIEQKELYTLNPDPEQDFLNPHKDRNFLSKLADPTNHCSDEEGARPILKSLKESQVPNSVIDSVLHGRELGLKHLPRNVKRVLHHNQADAFKAKLRKMQADGTWGEPDTPPVISPPPQIQSPTPTILSTLSSNLSDIPSSVTSGPTPSVSTPTIPPPQQMPLQNNPYITDNTPSHATFVATPNSGLASTPSYANSAAQMPPNAPDSISYYSGHAPFETTPVSLAGHTPSYAPNPSSILHYPSNSFGMQFGDNVTPTVSYTQSPAIAMDSVFGNTSTNSVPNFSSATFQDPQIPQVLDDSTFNITYINSNHLQASSFPVQQNFHSSTNQGGPDQITDLAPLLDNLDSIPVTHDWNQNGDQIMEDLLKEVDEMNAPHQSDKLRYDAEVTATSDPALNPSHNDVLSSGMCEATGQYVVGVSEVNTANGGNNNNSDVLEILSQFS